MKIDTFITCVGANALNFLYLTLGFNKKFFDNIYILTTPDDVKTQEFCAGPVNVNCLTTNLFTKSGAKFNRGAVLNWALEKVSPQDFICHLDSDIVIPSAFQDWKDKIYHTYGPLSAMENFYGMRRIIIPTFTEFLNFIKGGISREKFECPPGVAFGFLQLWHSQSKIVKSGAKYPESYDSSESDWQWRNLWGETVNGDWEYTNNLKRIEIDCLHLGSPNIETNQNFWDSIPQEYLQTE